MVLNTFALAGTFIINHLTFRFYKCTATLFSTFLFPECYQFDELELNRIIASAIKSEQCQRIIEIVKKESADKRENAVVKAESEVAGDEGTGKSENA